MGEYLTKEEVLKIFDIFIEFVDETCNDNTLKKYKNRLEEVLKEFNEIKKKKEEIIEKDRLDLEEKVKRDFEEMSKVCRIKKKCNSSCNKKLS